MLGVGAGLWILWMGIKVRQVNSRLVDLDIPLNEQDDPRKKDAYMTAKYTSWGYIVGGVVLVLEGLFSLL